MTQIFTSAVVLLTVLACNTSTSSDEAKTATSRTATPAAANDAQGRQVYVAYCAICHGREGTGTGEVASRFAIQPRDFTKGEYKIKSTPSGSLPTDADLARTITQGLPGTAMVPQDHLTEAEVDAVVTYIKSFSPRFAEKRPTQPIAIPSPPQKTLQSIARGKNIYREAACFQCHGPHGEGDGPSAAELSVKPTNLTHRPLKSGPRSQDLFRTILTGFDGTPMPAYQFVLEDNQLWDLIYYIESLAKPSHLTEDERGGWEIVQKLRQKE
jgi:mono/diheme cytochrome c family protein